MASPLLILLILVPLALAHKDHKCKEDFKKLYEASKAMIENGEAPDCYSKLELKQFKCSNPEDMEEHKEMHKKFQGWFKEQPEDKQKAVKDCFVEFGTKALEKADVSEECRDKMKEMKEKMME